MFVLLLFGDGGARSRRGWRLLLKIEEGGIRGGGGGGVGACTGAGTLVAYMYGEELLEGMI